MPKDVNFIFVLIPKENDANSFGKFFPINLCNFLYKIISKVMEKRLKTILPLIISSIQGDFVRGR